MQHLTALGRAFSKAGREAHHCSERRSLMVPAFIGDDGREEIDQDGSRHMQPGFVCVS
jgi:hypothetical protein